MLYAVVAAVFVVMTIQLASQNNSPGDADSMTSLQIARSIVNGEGMLSRNVCQHVVPVDLPHVPIHRKPAFVLLVAGLFSLFGVNLAVPVVFNALTILAVSFVVFRVLRLIGSRTVAYGLAAFYLVSGHYELISLLNNNLLTLLTCLLLWIGCACVLKRLRMRSFFILALLVACCGVALKPTFILSAAAASFFVFLVVEPACSWRSVIRAGMSAGLLCLATLAVLTPMWLPNVIAHGSPFHSVQPALRLSERYACLPHGTFETVRYNQPVTYGDAIGHLGVSGLVKAEIGVWVHSLKSAVLQNPLLYLFAILGGVLSIRRKVFRIYGLVAGAACESFLVPTLLWAPEDRYYWPLFACIVIVAGFVIVDLRSTLSQQFSAENRRRFAIVVALLFVIVGADAARYGVLVWSRSFSLAHTETPAWAVAAEHIPEDAIVLTNNPFAVSYWTNRKSVIIPRGDVADLTAVLEQYRPSYYLDTSGTAGTYAFRVKRDLVKVASSAIGEDRWALFEIRRPDASSASF
jgi:4-amino-4-deoxy-L-arabinose transferase-like glycosyltransferase